MFKIGNWQMPNRVVSAPMAGVSDRAYRFIARLCGCGLVFSEMISDMGLVYSQVKTQQLADRSGEASPVAMQIFGSQVEPMVKGAMVLQEKGADIIDINMGCPTPKIIKNGEGAALMLDIPRARTIIREIVQAVRIPVTVKMRKGWNNDDETCVELAQMAEAEGVSAITLHPRSRSQFFSGYSDWDMIKKVKKIISIPVIGNGDIMSAEDARRMLDYTGCDAVMIGRAAMGNPFIFRESVELLEYGRYISPPSVEERLSMANRHLELACSYKGETVGVREMRKHLSWYIRGMRGAARIREEINRAASRREMNNILNRLLED
ncbi:MAG: tRNA dihydrouridine synthase DusB [Syntrophomonadaceae bacterium]|jgi:tRNA-dihydrouridine synthase B